nr:MAG TPA: Protein of unknown function (DUF2921) [Caudoviricetes sp.]
MYLAKRELWLPQIISHIITRKRRSRLGVFCVGQAVERK